MWAYEFWNHVMALNQIIIRVTPAEVRTSTRRGINIREDAGISDTPMFIGSAPESPDSGQKIKGLVDEQKEWEELTLRKT
jgi:hypothetical protein